MNLKQKIKNLELDNEALKQANIFLGKMIVLGAIFHLIIYINPDTTSIQEFYAALITYTFQLFGFSFVHNTVYIETGTVTFEIIKDCLGWKSMALFTALVLSSTKQYVKNLRYIFLGVLGIAVANYVRVVSTVYLTYLEIISFDIVHDFLWQWGLSSVVLGLWGYWFFFIQKDRTLTEYLSR